MKNSKNKGFTLIEILVVIGIIAILAAVVLIAINPARQFAQARNSQRVSNVNAILNAIGQRMADNKGKFDGTLAGLTCPTLPSTSKEIEMGTGTATNIDLACLVPTYLPAVPFDPSVTNATASTTKYFVVQDTNGRVTVSATANADLNQTISVTR